MSASMNVDVRDLRTFAALGSDDDLKRELELTCLGCGDVICDIESDDTLETLVNMVVDHTCSEVTCERHGGPWGDDLTCKRCTDNHGNTRPVDEPGPLNIDEEIS